MLDRNFIKIPCRMNLISIEDPNQLHVAKLKPLDLNILHPHPSMISLGITELYLWVRENGLVGTSFPLTTLM